MFEGLLPKDPEKKLLSFVSRSHLQMEYAGEDQLKVRNLSQNVSIAGKSNLMLYNQEEVLMGSGETVSFAAEADKVPGIVTEALIATQGVEKQLAPFLTFRLVKTGV